MKTVMSRVVATASIVVSATLTLSGCTASEEAKAFEACKQYVELGYASNDDVSSYCMETSEGSGETSNVDAIKRLITQHNQDRMGDSDYEQIKVDF